MKDKLILMPESLTAENGAKGLMSGEFFEATTVQCQDCGGDGFYDNNHDEMCEVCLGIGDYIVKVPIGWTTIKEIYAMYVKYFQNQLENNKG